MGKIDKTELISNIRSFAQISPLLAAVLAPFSTLLDIPALTQEWYSYHDVPVPDFKASLILSAIGLAFNVVANILLVFRFSTGDRWWKVATRLSVLAWITKVIVALVNLSFFAIKRRTGQGYSYLEGFWCAVSSLLVSAGVLFFLFFHWAIEFNTSKELKDGTCSDQVATGREVRIYGRHFMLQVTSFVAAIGLNALILSRIEGWSYFDGIYFAVITALTIGFGDFTPTTTAGRIVLFPFAVFTIAQLANIIGILIGFFQESAEKAEAAWQIEFERKYHEKHDEENPNPDLNEEVRLLERIHREVEMRQQIRAVFYSVAIFIVFWLIGAIIFWKIEGWTYGDSLYFCYVFFFTIGYGDFSPVTNGGRVFFVIYALIAVPIMTSFAVQTVTSILAYVSNRRLHKREMKRKIEPNPEGSCQTKQGEFQTHSALVEDAHTRIERRSLSEMSEESTSSTEAFQNEEMSLTHHVLSLTLKLEGHARRVLVGRLVGNSDESVNTAGMLLKADWNVQRRELITILGDDIDATLDIDGDGKGDFEPGAKSDMQKGVFSGEDTLKEIKQYRECFAELLAAGSRLKGLEGQEKLVFERRKGKPRNKRKPCTKDA